MLNKYFPNILPFNVEQTAHDGVIRHIIYTICVPDN